MEDPIRRIAFIGLGIMGSRMAANLCRAGFEVTAWNRTRARAEELHEAHAAAVADSAAEAVAAVDATITMVVDGAQVEEVLFGSEGAAEGLRPGSLVIDMSTIAPSASTAIGERLGAERDVRSLDAPVTGSRPKAEDGTLTIMVGGEAADFERARPVLQVLGELVVHVGPRGHGSTAKLINNTLAAVNAAAIAEALELARAAGLDSEALLRVVAAGSGASAMLDLKARPMLERDYDPLFKLAHMLKDVRHLLDEAERLAAAQTLAAAAEALYSDAADAGLAEQDFAAVIEATRTEAKKGLENP